MIGPAGHPWVPSSQPGKHPPFAMSVASRLFPGLSIQIGDLLVFMPCGLLYVAANIRTGVVYSSPARSFLPQNFVVGEGGLNVFAFSINAFEQDGMENRSPTINQLGLSATSIAALQEYVRNNALALFGALGFPQAFYVVGGFQRQESTFTRVSGIIVRMQAPENDQNANGANGAAIPANFDRQATRPRLRTHA
ncbi:hypothetical protein ONZ45_g10175 [Pleurotus djamor]|nr:hypothetical protein ONZ45_g10175 [Pleurotus djamor]